MTITASGRSAARVRRTAGAFFALLLATACRSSGVEEISKYPDEGGHLPRRLTVVNWNVQKGGQPTFERDLQDLVEGHEPDLIFLQEAHRGLVPTDRLGGHFAKSWDYPWPGGRSIGVITMARLRPIATESIPTFWREFLLTAPKVSLATTYPLSNGQTLLAVNVHCLNFERWSTLRLRSQLRGLLEVMEHHDGPILVGGDFNTWSLKRLRLVEEMTRRLALVEVTGFPEPPKTADKNPFLNWLLGIDKTLPLDRFYYRGLSVSTAKVLPYRSSDHKPLLVTFVTDPPPTRTAPGRIDPKESRAQSSRNSD